MGICGPLLHLQLLADVGILLVGSVLNIRRRLMKDYPILILVFPLLLIAWYLRCLVVICNRVQ